MSTPGQTNQLALVRNDEDLDAANALLGLRNSKIGGKRRTIKRKNAKKNKTMKHKKNKRNSSKKAQHRKKRKTLR